MTAVPERETDAHWMREALRAAHEANERGEVPVGACIVTGTAGGDAVLPIAGNRTRTDQDPTAHAEIVALREAAQEVRQYPAYWRGCLFDDRTLRDVCGRFDSGASEAIGLWRAGRARRSSGITISDL